MLWNFIRPFAKRRPATGPASVSSAQEARPAAADPVPKRRRAAPLLDLPPAAQARALVSLLQEEDHGVENQIRNPEMRQIHLELCAREGHMARGLCWRGATDCDLAEAFDVTTVTIWRWRAKHEEFCNAVKAGKDAFDDRVERSLAQRAMGYTYHVEKVFHFQGRVIRPRLSSTCPPDPRAAKFWLCNRRPDKWRDNGDPRGRRSS